jgi:hypothetical protein
MAAVDPAFLDDLADFVVNATASLPTTTAAEAQPHRALR